MTRKAAVKDTAAEARSILCEDAPRSAAEQAAVDALDKKLWALWHADDYRLGVVLLLSRAGLLRDVAHEREMDEGLIANARLSREDHLKDKRRISALMSAIDQACDQLAAGNDPAEVSARLKDVRDKVLA